MLALRRRRTVLVGVLSTALSGLLVPGAPTSTVGAPSSAVSAAATVQPQIRAALPAKARAGLTLAVSHRTLHKGERVWLAGRLTGADVAGRTVHVQRKKAGSSRWRSYTSDRTSRSGRFAVSVRPSAGYQFRARVVATLRSSAATSATRSVRLVAGDRNLSQRARSLGKRLGSATTPTRSLSAAKRRAARVPGVRSVAWRGHSKGLLVKVTTRSATRTWLVDGKIRRAYEAAGGPRGRYGVPLADARCGLLENGCVQRFSRGTLYSSDGRSKATGTRVTGRQGEVVATVRSQVGYTYRYQRSSSQRTKFNRWMGSRKAWCSFLQSWASEASGNGRLIPKEKTFRTFEATVKRTMRTGSTPKVGALVFFNTFPPSGVITHVGMVVGVGGRTITVVDGNTSGNLPPSTRGVLEREWPRSRALLYAYPDY